MTPRPHPRFAMLPVALSILLAGCGQSARNEAAEAGQTIGGDANGTMGEAVKDVDAASEAAFGAAEASMNASGTPAGNQSANVADATGADAIEE